MALYRRSREIITSSQAYGLIRMAMRDESANFNRIFSARGRKRNRHIDDLQYDTILVLSKGLDRIAEPAATVAKPQICTMSAQQGLVVITREFNEQTGVSLKSRLRSEISNLLL
jgi:hypothetical protein